MAITITDHQINDLKSFADVTSNPHQVAGLYFFHVLDCLIDLAHKVSFDFYDRPELFTDLPDPAGGNATETLARLHARYGCDELFLGHRQRKAIYAALFGKLLQTDGEVDTAGNFSRLRDELLEACAVFAESKFGDAPSLRENVRQKHRVFKEYITGLLGASVRWSRERALADLTENVSYGILRNKGVAAVYGVATPPTQDWPYTFDSNADKLIEKMSKQLLAMGVPEDPTGTGEMARTISREEITNLQRAALEGAKAIATAIDVDAGSNDEDIDLLIRKCYTWGTAIRSLRDRTIAPARSFTSRAAEKPRAGIAVAQPLSGSASHPRQ